MTTRRIGNGAAIYRIRKDLGNVADHDLGLCSPIYRGFRLVCIGTEIEAMKRKVDHYWTTQTADTPAGRVSVLMEERAMRFQPRDWTGA